MDEAGCANLGAGIIIPFVLIGGLVVFALLCLGFVWALLKKVIAPFKDGYKAITGFVEEKDKEKIRKAKEKAIKDAEKALEARNKEIEKAQRMATRRENSLARGIILDDEGYEIGRTKPTRIVPPREEAVEEETDEEEDEDGDTSVSTPAPAAKPSSTGAAKKGGKKTSKAQPPSHGAAWNWTVGLIKDDDID